MRPHQDDLRYEPELGDFPVTLASMKPWIDDCPQSIRLRTGELTVDPQEGRIAFNGRSMAVSPAAIAWLSVAARPELATPESFECWDGAAARLELSELAPALFTKEGPDGVFVYQLDLMALAPVESFRLATAGGIVEVSPDGLRFGQNRAPLTRQAAQLLADLSVAGNSAAVAAAWRDKGASHSELSDILREVRLRSSELGCALLDFRQTRGTGQGEIVRLFGPTGANAEAASFEANLGAVPLVNALVREVCRRKPTAWVESNIPSAAGKLLAAWSAQGLDLRGVNADILEWPGIETFLNGMIERMSPGIQGYPVHRDVPQIPGVVRLKIPEGFAQVGPDFLKFGNWTLELPSEQAELLHCFVEHRQHALDAFLARGHSSKQFSAALTELYDFTKKMGCSLFEYEKNRVEGGWGIQFMFRPVTAEDVVWAQAQEGRARDCLLLRTHGVHEGLVAASPGALRRLSSRDAACVVGPEVVLPPGASKLLDCLMHYDDHELAFEIFRHQTTNMQAGRARAALLNACDALGLQLIPERSRDGMRSRWFQIDGVFRVVAPPSAAAAAV